MRRYTVVRISYTAILLVLGVLAVITTVTVDAVRSASSTVDKQNDLPTVILDAGHGGEDGGTVGSNGVLEKDINLSITLITAKKLSDCGITVKLIRDTDISVGDSTLTTVSERKRSDIKHRVQMVNDTDNCILVSVHQNFFEQSQYYGAQMFYSPNHPNSAVLAECIREDVVSRTQPDNHRENKKAESGIYLLNHVNVPAVIVECGFLSNPEEAGLLCDPVYQDKMAEAIAAGIMHYLQAE